MRIVVNHLTRMRGERLCVAGIDRNADRHIRPTTDANDPLTRDLLVERGGPLRIGAVLDLGNARPEPGPPEVEDHRTSTGRIWRVGAVDGDEYLSELARVAVPDLESAFGPTLERMTKSKFATPEGQGSASLAVVSPEWPIALSTDFDGLSVRFQAPDGTAYAKVTDLRFFDEDHRTLRADVVEDVRRRLDRGVKVHVMYGLGRPFAGAAEQPCHWLQVNGLCLEDRPVGDVP